ncbi:MAG TPA: cardiolipin synthase [Gemmatimonadota bacterium]|nr:cardiolipin synthase [Gemmatimonadota bacterium]
MGEISLLSLGHVLLALGLSLDVLLHKDRPVSAVLWLAILWAVPYAGAVGYLAFGVDRISRGARERRVVQEMVRQSARLAPRLDRHILRASDAEPGAPDRLGRHILRGTDPAVPAHRVLTGNRARLLVDGDEFYPALHEAIREAERTVHLQTFIYAADDSGRALRELLARRAGEGVTVRLLYDRFGSARAHVTRFLEPARRAGVQVRSISQANPLKGRFQINLRNHRKVAVVDGRVGFVGGINVSDRNTSGDGGGAPIRDYHVRLEGPAVADLQLGFAEDWLFATGQPAESLLGPDCLPALEPAGEALVQVVPGGPESAGRGLAEAFFAAIVAAEESIDIVTPYFVPDEPLIRALRYAARRGVGVRLVVPGRNNHWYTGFAARSLYGPLLEAGVRVFERRPPFMHAKAMVVDGVYAMLGSANLDYRSLHLNFETNVEIVDPGFVGTVARQVQVEVDASREITREAYASRPLTRRLAENVCRLFEPVL